MSRPLLRLRGSKAGGAGAEDMTSPSLGSGVRRLPVASTGVWLAGLGALDPKRRVEARNRPLPLRQ